MSRTHAVHGSHVKSVGKKRKLAAKKPKKSSSKSSTQEQLFMEEEDMSRLDDPQHFDKGHKYYSNPIDDEQPYDDNDELEDDFEDYKPRSHFKVDIDL